MQLCGQISKASRWLKEARQKKASILCDSMYMNIWKEQNWRDIHQSSDCQGAGDGRRGLITTREYKENLGCDGNDLYFDGSSGYMTVYIHQDL